MDTPMETISKFIVLYENEDGVNEQLFALLEAAMGSKQADEWTGDERTDMIFFCRQLSAFVKATFLASKLLGK
ncbi:hypothetical protein [Chitinophaga sp. YIM B06452]|uniref:hypothetical protein n=1 Tax=Chitinophaga sp. YIM B06452 TaxID=3082158 RepID=UPI0031FEDC32